MLKSVVSQIPTSESLIYTCSLCVCYCTTGTVLRIRELWQRHLHGLQQAPYIVHLRRLHQQVYQIASWRTIAEYKTNWCTSLEPGIMLVRRPHRFWDPAAICLRSRCMHHINFPTTNKRLECFCCSIRLLASKGHSKDFGRQLDSQLMLICFLCMSSVFSRDITDVQALAVLAMMFRLSFQ